MDFYKNKRWFDLKIHFAGSQDNLWGNLEDGFLRKLETENFSLLEKEKICSQNCHPQLASQFAFLRYFQFASQFANLKGMIFRA